MKDERIGGLIREERERQGKAVNLIASENYVSADVLEALGSILTNKYAEGYPGKRYYGGNETVDKIETECRNRALETFGLSAEDWAANVQPLSGSPANLAIYTALLKPGEKIMGMSLNHGGHLTHGHGVSASGIFFTQVAYGVNKETGTLDYEAVREIALREKPQIIVAGYTAYPRFVDWQKFREIADACGAYLMVDMSHLAGLVAGGAYPSPFPHADVVMATTHKTLRGPRSAVIFSRKDGREIDKKIDRAVFPGLQGGPHLNQIAAVAVALKEAQSDSFRQYAFQTLRNAAALAQEMEKLGWSVVSGGTDTHLVLVDTWMDGRGISGKEASDRLEKAGIIVNKNTIPNETRSPADPSGIRLGTAAETTRGKTEADFIRIAQDMDRILRSA